MKRWPFPKPGRRKGVAFLGIGAYRAAFGKPKAGFGRQGDDVGGAVAWVLPNPSGLNAHYTPTQLALVFGEFRKAVEGLG